MVLQWQSGKLLGLFLWLHGMQVQLVVESLVGCLPVYREAQDLGQATVRPSALWVEAVLADRYDTLGMPARTAYAEAGFTGCTWNTVLTFVSRVGRVGGAAVGARQAARFVRAEGLCWARRARRRAGCMRPAPGARGWFGGRRRGVAGRGGAAPACRVAGVSCAWRGLGCAVLHSSPSHTPALRPRLWPRRRLVCSTLSWTTRRNWR